MTGVLHLCSTPIGNLADASERLGDVLAAVDVVYAEDTRRTSILLGYLGVRVPLRSYFVGNEEQRAMELSQRMAAGENVALVTDAGTPAIADPGISAVRAARSVGAKVVVVPGPSAVTAALAGSGMPADRFVFEGFLPPRGSVRLDRLRRLTGETRTAVLFCAPHDLTRLFGDLAEVVGGERRVAVARELTKVHEEMWWGTVAEAIEHWSHVEPRGEFTIVVEGAGVLPSSIEDGIDAVRAAMRRGRSMGTAVREVAEVLGLSRRSLYQAVLEESNGP